MKKDFQQRLEDLRSHAQLLLDSCDRFAVDHNFDEVKNIGIRLRVLVGSQSGDGLMSELAAETKDIFSVMKLNQNGFIQITEMDSTTGKIVQQVKKRALFTQLAGGRLPIVFAEKDGQSLYSSIDLSEWLENGFLLDWEVPDEGRTPKMRSFTPRFLIERYAGQEAAHADSTHGVFGSPVESLTMEYSLKDQKLIVPVVHEYLFQIGLTVANIALEFVRKYKSSLVSKIPYEIKN